MKRISLGQGAVHVH